MRRSAIPYGCALLLLTAIVLSPLWAGPFADTLDKKADDWSSLTSGREVYEAACASCHGARGSGVDRNVRGFEVDPPDFTDCAFTSREPAADWEGIASEGGPVKGFSRLMPAFGRVLSKQQIKAAVKHTKTYCDAPHWKWPVGEFNLPKAINTGKAFPENEVAWSVRATMDEPWSIDAKFVVAKRIGARHQIEVAVPVGVHQVERATEDGGTALTWGAGASDLVAAWKSVMWQSLRAGSIGSVTLDVFFPTGDEADDFSDGIFAFEPAMAIAQIIPHVGFIQLQGGAELSTNTDIAPHGVFWRGAVGHIFRKGGLGRSWTPMVELLGGVELGGNAPVEWDIVPELQVSLSKRQHVRLGAGVCLPLNEFDTRQIQIQTYLIWDWYDGGFAEGWK